MSLANFAAYSKKNIQVYKIDDGDARCEIRAVNCDGMGERAFMLPHIWKFYLSILGIEFAKEANKITLCGFTLSGNVKAR